ncbi:dipeptide epimerase [Herbiconiux sp. YIM B11900]|uniref:dipeptide epimerase n=1 Tax=Herbiconiux sp. YIM B11900 TaxID=3404131 RepID=UPI003F869374
MSTIERVVVHHVSVPLRRPFVTAVRTATTLQTVLVQLVDSDGRSGWGESPVSWRVTGESPASVETAVTGPVGDAVLGRDPMDLADLGDAVAGSVVQNASARSGVDCALHDLAAQCAGAPLFEFLGGMSGSVTSDMTLSATPDHGRLADDARRHVAAGFRTLKVKVGAGGDDDLAVRVVRDAIGPGIGLRVDANQAWTADRAIALTRGWEDAGVGLEFVEQPVAARQLDDLARVTDLVDTPVLADESVWDTEDLREIIRRRAADAVNLKLAKSGGLTRAREMAELAASAGVPVIVGCMMESTVGIGAAAGLASALDASSARDTGIRGPAHDLDAGLWLAGAAVEGGAGYDGDTIVLAPSAGAGIVSLREPVVAEGGVR